MFRVFCVLMYFRCVPAFFQLWKQVLLLTQTSRKLHRYKKSPGYFQVSSAPGFFRGLFCALKSQSYTAPGQALAVFSSVYPEFSGQFAVSSGFQRVMKRKSGCCIKRIILKYDNCLPEVLFCAGCFYIFYCIFHLIVHHSFMSNNVESFRFI